MDEDEDERVVKLNDIEKEELFSNKKKRIFLKIL